MGECSTINTNLFTGLPIIYARVMAVAVAVMLGMVDTAHFGVSDNSVEPHQKSTNRFVYAVFRHGIRSPLYEPYPNDPNKDEFHKYFDGPLGMLTKVGKRQMYKVGKMLKERYIDFLGEYSEEKMRITSTNTTRTIMTALSVMAGLFPPKKVLFHDLMWQPIPVWHDTIEFDKAYIYNDVNFPETGLLVCPTYGELIKRGYEIITNPDKTKERSYIYNKVRKLTGNPNVTSVEAMYQTFDILQFENLNGLPLPKWATKPQKSCGNKPLYPDLMTPIKNEWFIDTEYLYNNTKMLQFYSGPMFNSIHEAFVKKAQDPHLVEKFRFHTTHDTTLYAILWGMGLKEPSSIEPGDGILFELNEVDGNFYVEVLYFNGVLKTLKQLHLPECPPPCNLLQFITASPALTPTQWQQWCTSSVFYSSEK